MLKAWFNQSVGHKSIPFQLILFLFVYCLLLFIVYLLSLAAAQRN